MLLINLAGIALIALIVWWFWLYKPQEAQQGDSDLIVTVENGTYSPSRIKILAGQETHISFLRKDASPCAETVLFPDLQISEMLPLNRVKSIQLPALSTGGYSFYCQMQMYRGEITAE